MIEFQNTLNEIWPDWVIEETLGKGSYGTVYRIVRADEFNHKFTAALKVITIPDNDQEYRQVINEGMDEESATDYFQSIVQDVVDEIVMMSQLKGNTNIVSYEDHIIKKAEDSIQWRIFIRMELLTPLYTYMKEKELSVRDVIRLGIEMCNALEICQRYNIIHRDIKPENIFVSDVGRFKLGDFGIARKLERTSTGLSKKGTYSYMAPEVYKGEAYNSTVDIYSLGMVLYRLLNNNRGPFMPPYPERIRYSDRERANILRMSGTNIPFPAKAKGRLGEIILKACSYDPDKRYESAVVLREALETIAYEDQETDLIYPSGDALASLEKNDYVKDINLDDVKGAFDRTVTVDDVSISDSEGGSEVSHTEKTSALFKNRRNSDQVIVGEKKEGDCHESPEMIPETLQKETNNGKSDERPGGLNEGPGVVRNNLIKKESKINKNEIDNQTLGNFDIYEKQKTKPEKKKSIKKSAIPSSAGMTIVVLFIALLVALFAKEQYYTVENSSDTNSVDGKEEGIVSRNAKEISAPRARRKEISAPRARREENGAVMESINQGEEITMEVGQDMDIRVYTPSPVIEIDNSEIIDKKGEENATTAESTIKLTAKKEGTTVLHIRKKEDSEPLNITFTVSAPPRSLSVDGSEWKMKSHYQGFVVNYTGEINDNFTLEFDDAIVADWAAENKDGKQLIYLYAIENGVSELTLKNEDTGETFQGSVKVDIGKNKYLSVESHELELHDSYNFTITCLNDEAELTAHYTGEIEAEWTDTWNGDNYDIIIKKGLAKSGDVEYLCITDEATKESELVTVNIK